MQTDCLTINKNKRTWLVYAAIFCVMAVVLYFSFQRSIFLDLNESDYLGTYMPEAKRFLAGQPLKVNNHFPLYSIFIAIFNTLIQDWLKTGLIISIVSTGVGLIAVRLFFKELMGRSAALGAIIGCALCPYFYLQAGSAGSDALFFAAYFAFFLTALRAYSRQSSFLWGLCGVLCIVTLFIRTNGFLLILAGLLPIAQTASLRKRFGQMAAFGAGAALPLCAWFIYCRMTDTAFMPSKTYLNIAMTYFSPTADRMSGDAYAAMALRFKNMGDVLSHDPLRIAAIYITDFLAMIARNFFFLMNPIVAVIGTAGIFLGFITGSKNRIFSYFFLFVTALHLGLLNLKTYEYRYYLFLVPILGASAGAFMFKDAGGHASHLKILRNVILVLIAISFPITLFQVHRMFHSPYEKELLSAIAAVSMEAKDGNGTILSRKPNLAYHTGLEWYFLPNVDSVHDLETTLENKILEKPVYLFWGGYERSFRGRFGATIQSVQGLRRLKPVAKNDPGSPPWILYKLNLDDEMTNQQFGNK